MSDGASRQELRKALISGKGRLHFESASVKETPAKREARTISASWLVDFLSASPPELRSLDIRNAVIDGALDLSFQAIDVWLSIVDSVFNDEVDLTGATLRRGLRLDGSRFEQGLALAAAKIGASFSARRAEFIGAFDAIDLSVGVTFDVSDACFYEQADLQRVLVEKAANFSHAQFQGNALFLNGRFRGVATFDGASFSHGANFDEAQFEETVYLRSDDKTLVFGGDVLFTDVKVGGMFFVSESLFQGRVDCTRARFDGGLQVFGSTFKSQAIFAWGFGPPCLPLNPRERAPHGIRGQSGFHSHPSSWRCDLRRYAIRRHSAVHVLLDRRRCSIQFRSKGGSCSIQAARVLQSGDCRWVGMVPGRIVHWGC